MCCLCGAVDNVIISIDIAEVFSFEIVYKSKVSKICSHRALVGSFSKRY